MDHTVQSILDMISLEKKSFDDAVHELKKNHNTKMDSLKELLKPTTHCKFSLNDYVEVVDYFGNFLIVGKVAKIIIDDYGLVRYKIKPVDDNGKEIEQNFHDLEENLSIPLPENRCNKIEDIKAYFGKISSLVLRDLLINVENTANESKERIVSEYIKRQTDITVGNKVEIITEYGIFEGMVYQILVDENMGKFGQIQFMIDVNDTRSRSRFVYGTLQTIKKKDV